MIVRCDEGVVVYSLRLHASTSVSNDWNKYAKRDDDDGVHEAADIK